MQQEYFELNDTVKQELLHAPYYNATASGVLLVCGLIFAGMGVLFLVFLGMIALIICIGAVFLIVTAVRDLVYCAKERRARKIVRIGGKITFATITGKHQRRVKDRDTVLNNLSQRQSERYFYHIIKLFVRYQYTAPDGSVYNGSFRRVYDIVPDVFNTDTVPVAFSGKYSQLLDVTEYVFPESYQRTAAVNSPAKEKKPMFTLLRTESQDRDHTAESQAVQMQTPQVTDAPSADELRQVPGDAEDTIQAMQADSSDDAFPEVRFTDADWQDPADVQYDMPVWDDGILKKGEKDQ